MAAGVRVMGDLGGWPLWMDEPEESTQSPDEWPMLSDELKARLQEWNLAWISTSPQSTAKTTRQLAAEAETLADEVQVELGSDFEVRLSL